MNVTIAPYDKHAARMMSRARSILFEQDAFYGALCMNLEPVQTFDFDTAATDGARLFYNPEYFLSLVEPARIGLLVHETEHCGMCHFDRIGSRDLEQANVAADLAINPDIGKRWTLFPGALNDPAFYGMSMEEIYAARQRKQAEKANQDKPGKKSDDGQDGAQGAGAGDQSDDGKPGSGAGQEGQDAAGKSGDAGKAGAGEPGNGQDGGKPGKAKPKLGGGGVIKPGDGSAAACADMAAQWQVKVAEATAIARRAGEGTGNGERMMKASKPAIDAHQLLRDFIDSNIVNDSSFLRPNRRFVGAGMYLPGAVIDGLEHVIWAVDTSGSINQRMLDVCAATIIESMEAGKIRKLTVIYADDAVCSVQQFDAGEDIKLVACGGGGTDFADTFATIARDYDDASAVIYLTDMETRTFGQDPGIPTMWAVHGDPAHARYYAEKAPFGDIFYLGRI